VSNGGAVAVSPVNYTLGDTVTLTASPVTKAFCRWSGDVAGTVNPITLLMTGHKSVIAHFESCVLASPGLVSFWRAENDGRDAAGSNHGTLQNGAGFTAGKINKAFSFDGVKSFIEIPDSPSLRPVSFTLEAWVNFKATNSVRLIFAKGAGSSISYQLWLELGTLKGAVGDATVSGAVVVSSPFSPEPGRWYHVAYTFDGVAAKPQTLYLDGVQVASNNTNRSIGYDNQPLLFGCAPNNGGSFLSGLIDEASFYSRALSAAEIATIYAADCSGKCTAQPYFTSSSQFQKVIVGSAYAQQITTSMGTGSVSFSLSSGQAPSGLTLSSSGLVSGVPTTVGDYAFTVRATEAGGLFTDQACTLRVVSATQAPSGLVSWWRAENDAQDAGGGNHGILQAGAGFAPGKVNQAFSFDGVKGFIEMPDSQFSLQLQSVTLEAWVNFNAADGARVIFAKPVGSLISYELWLESGTLKGAIGDATSIGPVLSFPFSPELGRWYHVAYAFSVTGQQQALYLDGVQVAIGAAARSIGYDSQPLLLGCGPNKGMPTSFFSGLIDEASIYNRFLTPAEIASIFNAGASGKSVDHGTP